MKAEVEIYLNSAESLDELKVKIDVIGLLTDNEVVSKYATPDDVTAFESFKKMSSLAKTVGLNDVMNSNEQKIKNLLRFIKSRAKDLVRIEFIKKLGLESVSEEDMQVWHRFYGERAGWSGGSCSLHDPHMPLSVLEVIADLKKSGLMGDLYILYRNLSEYALFGHFDSYSNTYLFARWFEYEDKQLSAGNLIKSDKHLLPLDKIREIYRSGSLITKVSGQRQTGLRRYGGYRFVMWPFGRLRSFFALIDFWS